MFCYLENKTKTISTETKLTERNATITSHNHMFINFPKKKTRMKKEDFKQQLSASYYLYITFLLLLPNFLSTSTMKLTREICF